VTVISCSTSFQIPEHGLRDIVPWVRVARRLGRCDFHPLVKVCGRGGCSRLGWTR
jgi:hypothetical protein